MKIAIAGYAVEGKANFDYFKKQGHDLTIIDERPTLEDAPEGIPTQLGEDAFKGLADFDMVVRTASMQPAKLIAARKVWSAANEFFARCPASIIGVTGSKGKGTVCSLIASILREAGQTVHLVGNIGVPPLDVLDSIKPEDIVVYELSSFQLWDIEKSPTVAVVLMIEPDHLDVHVDFNEYITAKANIRKYQTEKDICFYHPTNQFSRRVALASSFANAHKYNDPTDKMSVYAQNSNFVEDGCVICPVEALQLPGGHNIENACAAISAASAGFGVDREAIDRGLRAFHGLNHRLKLIREVSGVKYYDDSIATTPGSAIAAIKAFDQPKIIILGGSSKGGEYDMIAQAATTGNVKLAILIGDEADKIERAFAGSNTEISNLGPHTTMKEIVDEAQRHAQPGDVVVLSPACASFGLFKNYKDRGDQFIAAVNGLQ
jgi:UDP-N-acetylmuramoylalanine--D-glutamate ligase